MDYSCLTNNYEPNTIFYITTNNQPCNYLSLPFHKIMIQSWVLVGFLLGLNGNRVWTCGDMVIIEGDAHFILSRRGCGVRALDISFLIRGQHHLRFGWAGKCHHQFGRVHSTHCDTKGVGLICYSGQECVSFD